MGYLTHVLFSSDTQPSSSNCIRSHGKYNGPTYKNSKTISTTCLYETSWLRLMKHVVQQPHVIAHDWLYIDYHDRINVLVEHPNRENNSKDLNLKYTEKEFIILEQTKYALSDTSLAVVGGIVEPNEEPIHSAKREIEEELNVICGILKPLGKFHTDVNRGMGHVHSFVALDCEFLDVSNKEVEDQQQGESEVGVKDMEKQEFKVMNVELLKEKVKEGKFEEIQWCNTVLLALNGLENNEFPRR